MSSKNYNTPNPLLNKKELASLEDLTERYNKLLEPGIISKTGSRVAKLIPQRVRDISKSAQESITQRELFKQCMKVVSEGFVTLEKYASKTTVREETIISEVNEATKLNEITSLDEICLVRGYNVSKLVESRKLGNMLLALGEGGATGYFGFVGLPFNIVLSTFIYYRAVQSIAMYYGYDTKNDPSELMIASEVFMNALNPDKKGGDEIGGIIGKILVFSETTAIKQTAKKTWTEMASRGGVGLLLTQMRALANRSAQKALEKVGEKGLEESVFRSVFEQIGRKLSMRTISKAVPVFGAIVGGLFDTAIMNKVLEYAGIFYNKRFLLEKEVRINTLISGEPEIIDVDFEENVDDSNPVSE
ncbi:MAG: EcsC family protein [Paludibacteraceae bacterium]|nr:EcsC family protein [Paludibacteraceae bacterium]